jgi:protein-L-isoaspartate(D-aspartate) O-methyltransferase
LATERHDLLAEMNRLSAAFGRTSLPILRLLAAVLAASALALSARADTAQQRADRAAMLRTIERHAQSATEALGRDHIDPAVLRVMGELPRDAFVPGNMQDQAYDDRPLPIGYSQTISQPFIVALMTDLLAPEPGDVVLEVGTGSGYQAAVLANLVDEVHSIEIIPGLAGSAAERLDELGFENVETHLGDGYYGVEAAAPFDAIVVTAAATGVPPPLIAQLKPGGRMVIPVGSSFSLQHLMIVEKDEAGQVRTRQTLPVRFVPLTRGS